MTEVGIIMGSKSDLPVMQDAADVLKELGVEYEISVVSAHRIKCIAKCRDISCTNYRCF
jgi:phosphoribosylcarboxyaminoimidazole (NCAIR) mutase